jgi:ElaB/YqjD/DUF883 family membrane-anchored ribosome-binding protein
MTISEANERLAADLRLVVRDSEELLKATAGEAGEKLKEVRNRLSKAVESAKATCEKIGDTAIKEAKAVDEVVRDHPYESIGIALGLGLLIGILVGRR